ncbi:MAG TPA: DUF6328 family protein [Nocardioidaceae bacterium]|nr:DUF6328 family protein [Nocardioidaceae bacterium]
MTCQPGAGAPGRNEDANQRIDRNWGELLQELRVVRTGIQLLSGFLLTLPFQQRFQDLSTVQELDYLAVVVLAIVASGLLAAPVSFHRAVFRRQQKEWLVLAAQRSARLGLVCMAISIAGVFWLIFSIVLGTSAASVAGALIGLFLVGLWFVVPFVARDR